MSDKDEARVPGRLQPIHPPFSSAIRFLDEELTGFQKARSADAAVYKKRHATYAYAAITAGFLAFSLAVTLVCYQALHIVTDESILHAIRWLELVLAIVALGAVVLGYYRKNQQLYLLNRYFSERARILFFRSLTSENLWACTSDDDWTAHTREKIRKLKDEFSSETARIRDESLLTFPVRKIAVILGRMQRPETAVKRFIREVQVHTPPRTIPCKISADACREFIDYYTRARLDGQIRFYENRLSGNAADRLTRVVHKIPHATFFGSIAAVSGHFILDSVGSSHHILSVVLLGIAVVLPFLGVTVRGYSEVFQTVRVLPLYQSKYQALKAYCGRIRSYESDPVQNWPEILKLMRQCENFFEDELREWLVLVHEADWYI